MEIRVLKPLQRTTALLEIWEGERLIAKVFARQDGVRRFHFSKEAAAWGAHWGTLSTLASKAFELLDAADEEMKQARKGRSIDTVAFELTADTR